VRTTKQEALQLVEEASAQGAYTLSEREAKLVLSAFGVAVAEEALASTADQAIEFAQRLGYPVVCKGCGRTLLHKTDMGLVELNLKDADQVRQAYVRLSQKLPADAEGVLISRFIKGEREFIAGMTRDPQFGPVVMFGMGGIFTETLSDVVFRVIPIEFADALEMLGDIKANKLLGSVRGMPEVNKQVLASILMGISDAVVAIPKIKEIDINPLIISGDQPIAVDALVKLDI